MQTQSQLITEFCGYVRDICAQPVEQQGKRLETVMARFADGSVRIAASSLVPLDVDLAADTDAALADRMQCHVGFRNGSALINSAWAMMVEAAKRLRDRAS